MPPSDHDLDLQARHFCLSKPDPQESSWAVTHCLHVGWG